MSDEDVRAALRGLASVRVPPIPKLEPRAERRAIGWAPLVAAAAMVALLIGALRVRPRDVVPPPPSPLAEKIAAVEARIARLEDPELRALLARELELLKRELSLAQPAP